MHWVYYAILILISLTGWILNLFLLPGLWLMVAAAAGYAWITSGWYLGIKSLVFLLVLAVLAELGEFVAGSAGAKKAGGTRRAMAGAIVGALVGGILFTGLVPIPILGTLVGVCLGAFLGAGIIELSIRRELWHSTRVGLGAAQGRLVGILIKLLIGLAMFLLAAWTAIPFASQRPALPVVPQPTTTTAPT
ncbi:MAG: DUF456 domain-containing protein [Phycisphaerales bacterium]|jgi:uncharacterized protein YqgC (DUF456 family)|nr:DUF456 domain-containing protein [Phycisphaerales bacterium]